MELYLTTIRGRNLGKYPAIAGEASLPIMGGTRAIWRARLASPLALQPRPMVPPLRRRHKRRGPDPRGRSFSAALGADVLPQIPPGQELLIAHRPAVRQQPRSQVNLAHGAFS